MIIDNFDSLYYFYINNYPFVPFMLDKQNKSLYLVISVIKRKKDDTDTIFNESEMIYKTYIIHTIDDIIKYKSDIVKLCDSMNARAYITYSPRDIKELYPCLLRNLAGCIEKYLDDTSVLTNIIDTSAKVTPVIDDDHSQYYMLDIDGEYTEDELDKIQEYIHKNGADIKLKYKTLHGWHIITTEYDRKLKTDLKNSGLLEKSKNDTISLKSSGCRALLYANVK